MSTAEVNRTDWLAERNRIPGIGASEAAALFGLHPNISAFSLFEKLVNPQPPTDEEIEEDADVKAFGLAIEPYLADWWTRKTNRFVAPANGIYRMDGKEHVFASPDRVVVGEEKRGVLELKSALFFNPADPLPDYWQIQVQQQMLCAVAETGSFAILGGFRRRYMVNDIPRNDAFCAILVETIDRFMFAVHAGSWDKWGGDIDGSRATTEALKRLYPSETGAVKYLPAESESWASELEATKDEIKRLQGREDQLKNQLRAEIADASFGVLPDGSSYSNKTVKGSTFTVTKADHRQLRKVAKIPKGLITV